MIQTVSHKEIAGMEVSLGAASGLRFKKKPSAFNMCISRVLKGQAPVLGGRAECRARFTEAVHQCAGMKKELPVEKTSTTEKSAEGPLRAPLRALREQLRRRPKAAVEESVAAPEKPPEALEKTD